MILNIITYLIETAVITSVLYLFYRYLYFKLAYFQWSRYYLYAVILTGIIIPALPVPEKHGFFNYALINIQNNILTEETTGLIKISNSIEDKNFINLSFILNALFIIWVSGFITNLFFSIKRLISILKIIKTSKKIQKGKFVFVYTGLGGSVFSFFKYIFLNKDFENLSENEKKQIIRHEKIHAKQLHSIDNLIFEIFKAVFWFNPVSKLISADIKVIHEFITDNILTGNKNKPDYSKLILKLSSQNNVFTATSSFSKEEIKNRIKLISFPENEKIRKRRFIVSIPILALTIFTFLIIVSSINPYILPEKNPDKILHKPFDKGNYKIISPWFQNKKVNGFYVSHYETDYEVKSFSEIYAVDDGMISDIKTTDIFGLKEISITEQTKSGYEIIIKGLYKSKVKKNNTVKKGQIIGTSGDIRLYPKISIKIMKNGKSLNPEKLY